MDLRFAAVVLGVLLTTGCESVSNQEIGRTAGGAVGAGGGAAVGYALGGTTGMFIGGIVGGAFGGFSGDKIGQLLDEKDKKKNDDAVAKALKTGRPQTWTSSHTGNSGKITVAYITPPPAANAQSRHPASKAEAQTPHCRMITQTIKLKNGETHAEERKVCS